MNPNLLLEQDGTETGVEGTDTLVLQHLGETTNETVGVGRLGDETDTGGLKRAEGNIGEELGKTRRGQVDGSTVLGGGLVAESGDGLLLEELVTAELQGTLQEVTSEGRADTGEKGASTLILDDLAETTDQTAVVGLGVELDTGLDAVEEGVSLNCMSPVVVSYLRPVGVLRANRARLAWQSAAKTRKAADGRKQLDHGMARLTHRRGSEHRG